MTGGTRDTPPDKLRVDKWLWHARFFRTRGLAAALAGSGRLRINAEHAARPSQTIRPGDVLTFPQGDRILRVIRIEALSGRRGPAPEAQALYTDIEPVPSPTAPPVPSPPAQRGPGAGRPTKKHRRKTDSLRRRDP